MRKPIRSWAGVASLLLLLALPHCSEDGETASPAGPSASGHGGAAPTDASVDGTSGWGGSGGLDAAAGCPSQILCGTLGACCTQAEECVDGKCAPACASGIRCTAPACCAAGQVCLSGQCATPGKDCGDSFDCDENQFCEPTLGKCLPQVQGTELCEYKPAVPELSPVIEWSWTESTTLPQYNQIQSLPLVADVDGDGFPDVLVATFITNLQPAHLRLLDGRNGTEKWPAAAEVFLPANAACPSTNQAIADLDADGKVEVVSLTYDNGLMAVDSAGKVIWKATLADGVTPYHGAVIHPTFPCNLLGSLAVADMDADGKAEIAIGGVIFDAKGKMLSGLGREGAGFNGIYGPISVIADVDVDGVQEVVTGKAAFRLDGTVLWDNGLTDGYTAIADLDADGAPEVIVTAAGTVRVQNAKTGVVLAQLAIPGGGPSGGPPTVADFDGDGRMDFSAAGANLYSAFAYTSKPAPAITVMWSAATHDVSPGTTGSSVFDFDGDGAAEVVYNDEQNLLVFNGADGAVRFQEPSSSLTGAEYPVVADVDGDNNTELVAISADYGAAGKRHGVFVYGDQYDRWVRTRRIWNQHSYHITNVNVDGSLPSPEADNWSAAAPNNYRVSSQGAGVFNAPDLRVDLEVSTETCPAGLTLRARVKNAGSLGVPAGVEVRFFKGSDSAGELLATLSTAQPLLPGQSEVVKTVYALSAGAVGLSFYVDVDGGTDVHECLTDNNSATAGAVQCPTVK